MGKAGCSSLNTVLTVQEGYANSHKGKGWEIFTDHIIEEMNKREKPVVFIYGDVRQKTKPV